MKKCSASASSGSVGFFSIGPKRLLPPPNVIPPSHNTKARARLSRSHSGERRRARLPMPDHPQHKLSPLILIGFAALLGLLTPACAASTVQTARVLSQWVGEDWIVRFEIDVDPEVFESETFRLCDSSRAPSQYRCWPLEKAVEDGRQLLTIDSEEHPVARFGIETCIIHVSSRHCEDVNLNSIDRSLFRMKEAERVRREAEGEKIRRDSLQAYFDAQAAQREQAARQQEERQRARDRQELERAIREDRCTLFHHAKDEATGSYINLYECEATAYSSGPLILVEKDDRILYRRRSQPADEDAMENHGPLLAIAEVRFSPNPHVDVLTREPSLYGSAYCRMRFDDHGARPLTCFINDYWEYSSFLDDYIYYDLRAKFSFIPEIVSEYREPIASFASVEMDFDAELNGVVCFGRPALWDEAELCYNCHPEALAEFEKRQTERVREYLNQGDPVRAFHELTENTDDALKAEVVSACGEYYARSLRELVRRRRQLKLRELCEGGSYSVQSCDEDALFDELFVWFTEQAFVCAPGSPSVQKVVDDYHYEGLTHALRGNTRRPGAAISDYFEFIKPIKDPKLAAKAMAALRRSSPIAPLEIAIAQLTEKGDVAGLRRQWSELFSPKGMDATTAAALRRKIDEIIKSIEHSWEFFWKSFDAGGFSMQMTIADAGRKCAELKGRWELARDRRSGACSLDELELPYDERHPATVALYGEDEHSLPDEIRILWRGAREDRARLDALHESLLEFYRRYDLAESIERTIGEASGAASGEQGAPRAPRTLRTTTWNLGSRRLVIERATLNVEAGAESPESVTLIFRGSRHY